MKHVSMFHCNMYQRLGAPLAAALIRGLYIVDYLVTHFGYYLPPCIKVESLIIGFYVVFYYGLRELNWVQVAMVRR